jgi:hypothetical protein
MFMNEGQFRFGIPLGIYFHRLFCQIVLRFEAESTL